MDWGGSPAMRALRQAQAAAAYARRTGCGIEEAAAALAEPALAEPALAEPAPAGPASTPASTGSRAGATVGCTSPGSTPR